MSLGADHPRASRVSQKQSTNHANEPPRKTARRSLGARRVDRFAKNPELPLHRAPGGHAATSLTEAAQTEHPLEARLERTVPTYCQRGSLLPLPSTLSETRRDAAGGAASSSRSPTRSQSLACVMRTRRICPGCASPSDR